MIGTYWTLKTKIGGIEHWYISGLLWLPDKTQAYKFLHPGDARHTLNRFIQLYPTIGIEKRFSWLPPLNADIPESKEFWHANAQEPVDFDYSHNNDSLTIRQGQVEVVLDDTEVLKLLVYYFELSDTETLIDLIRAIDR